LRKLGLAIICLLCVFTLTSLLMPGIKAQVTITIKPPSKDTWIDSYFSSVNFGDAGPMVYLNYGTWPPSDPGIPSDRVSRVLIEFDLSSIPPGATITSATLLLLTTATGGNPSGQYIRVCRITRSWVEGSDSVDGATWYTYDGSNPWTTSGGDYESDGVVTMWINYPNWMSLTVTDIVQGWVSGTYPNYGFLVKWDSESGEGRGIGFGSREGSLGFPPEIYAPRLEVTYTPPVEGVPEFALTFPVVTSIAVAAYLTIKRRISKN